MRWSIWIYYLHFFEFSLLVFGSETKSGEKFSDFKTSWSHLVPISQWVVTKIWTRASSCQITKLDVILETLHLFFLEKPKNWSDTFMLTNTYSINEHFETLMPKSHKRTLAVNAHISYSDWSVCLLTSSMHALTPFSIVLSNALFSINWIFQWFTAMNI